MSVHIVVVGNEKGGSGKTTLAVNLAIGLLHLGFRVGCIDLDCRQRSLFRYVRNRQRWSGARKIPLLMPEIAAIDASTLDSRQAAIEQDRELFATTLAGFSARCDFVVVDCPGSDGDLARAAHIFADTLITPINDSLLDLDLIGRLDPADWSLREAGLYAELIADLRRKRRRMHRSGTDWLVARSRLGALADRNKQKMSDTLNAMQKVLGFRLASGFGERIIYRYLFLWGLTVLDLGEAGLGIEMNRSHQAARSEVLDLLRALWLPQVDARLSALSADQNRHTSSS